MNQLKTDIAKLRKVAEEVGSHIKELDRELEDCVKAINTRQPSGRETPTPPSRPKHK